jgi:hypothetical protein
MGLRIELAPQPPQREGICDWRGAVRDLAIDGKQTRPGGTDGI